MKQFINLFIFLCLISCNKESKKAEKKYEFEVQRPLTIEKRKILYGNKWHLYEVKTDLNRDYLKYLYKDFRFDTITQNIYLNENKVGKLLPDGRFSIESLNNENDTFRVSYINKNLLFIQKNQYIIKNDSLKRVLSITFFFNKS